MFTDKETGETTRLRDSIDNLVRSPIWGELYTNIKIMYNTPGSWSKFWEDMSDGLDLDGENSARKTLGVGEGTDDHNLFFLYQCIVIDNFFSF